jgi:hypothetical protein
MAVTSSTAPSAVQTAAFKGTLTPSPARTAIAGSVSFWGAATAITLLGTASQTRGPTTYTGQALLKDGGVDLTDDQKKRLAESTRAAQQMEGMVTSSKNDRKAMAKQKIDQLKDRLKQLQMSGGDPKVIARLAAQLSRELKEAVREYGAASATAGMTSVGVAVSNPEVAAAVDAVPSNLAGDAGSSIEAGGSPVEAATVAAGTDAPAKSPESAVTASAEEDQVSSDRHAKPDEARVQALFDQVATRDADAAAAKAEREFINDIKTLAKQIRALFERSKHRAEQEKGSDLDLAQDGKAVGEATREIEKAVQDLEKGLQDDPAGGTGPAALGTAAAVPVAHFVSVLV